MSLAVSSKSIFMFTPIKARGQETNSHRLIFHRQKNKYCAFNCVWIKWFNVFDTAVITFNPTLWPCYTGGSKWFSVYAHTCRNVSICVCMYCICLFDVFATVPALGTPCWWRPVGPTSAHCWWETCGKAFVLQPTSLIFHPHTRAPLPFFIQSLLLIPALLFLALSNTVPRVLSSLHYPFFAHELSYCTETYYF